LKKTEPFHYTGNVAKILRLQIYKKINVGFFLY